MQNTDLKGNHAKNKLSVFKGICCFFFVKFLIVKNQSFQMFKLTPLIVNSVLNLAWYNF